MMGRDLLIRGGRIVDPSSSRDGEGDILILKGRLAPPGTEIPEGIQVLDAFGMIVLPGLIDMHVHLREPGYTYKEDIESGTAAAAAGGFTGVACMPNTDPVADNDTVISAIVASAKEHGHCRVYPIGAVTKGSLGKELAEMGKMARAGAVAFSDDGEPVSTPQVLRAALSYLETFGKILIDHPEDKGLSAGGQMNLGPTSMAAGFTGIPVEAEEIGVARDIAVSKLTGQPIHLTHISTKGSVHLIREAKARGMKVTCDCTPHHLVLTDALVLASGYDTNTKVNPPLRSEEDVEALRQGLIDGTIDAIATDHAPHHIDDKWVEYEYAANGISGLDTAVGLVVDQLVRLGLITWMQMAALMSQNPARILGVPGGSLASGGPGDVTVIDPELEYPVDPRAFKSKGKNTPFAGWRLRGGPHATVIDGKVVALGRELAQ